MNIARIKVLCWAAVVGLVGFLGWDVYQFVTVIKGELETPLSNETQRGALEDDVAVPGEETRQLVPYQRVQSTFFDLKWDGRPDAPPAPPPPPPGEKPKARPKPVSELLTVLLIQYRTAKPEESLASVTYQYGPKKNGVLGVGDALRQPHQYAKVSDITPEYIEVSFDTREGEEEREPERVRPPVFRSQGKPVNIVLVDVDGEVRQPDQATTITVAADQIRWNPSKTIETRKNQYQIGTDDAARIAAEWSTILSRDVRTRRYRDPQTGHYTGIQISSIQSGSIVSSHGVESGDIVKSINGEPVTSTQEAISYVKTHSDQTTHWEVVVERQGRETTLTYDYEPASN